LFFFGSVEDEKTEDPDWLDGLLRAVATNMVAELPVAGLAYRFRPDQFVRELHVRPRAHAAGSAALDIESLREAFDKIDGCGWYAVPAEDGERPYFWIEGEFDGQEVFLRLLPDGSDGAGERKDWKVWKKP